MYIGIRNIDGKLSHPFQDTMWIGYPLSDDEPTIIHHFAFYEDLEDDGGFVYPNFANGFAMRIELMDR